jgi:hypothetical protein
VKYVLNNHGEIMEFNKKQYVEMCYTQLKAFSGHLIIFSVIPLVYFLDRIKEKQKVKENIIIKLRCSPKGAGRKTALRFCFWSLHLLPHLDTRLVFGAEFCRKAAITQPRQA